MRSTLCLVTFFLAFARAEMAVAQHHPAAHQQAQHQQPQHAAPQMNMNMNVGNQMAFFNNSNAGNFGYNGLNFPSHAITFPNGGLTFPTYASNFNLQGANAFHGYGNYGPYYSSGRQGRLNSNGLTPSSALMGTGTGIGSFYSAVPHHYSGTYHRARTSYHNLHTYQPQNANQISPAARHFNSLVADLDVLAPGFHAVDYHRSMIRNDILALVDGKDRPPTATVQQLASHLTNAMVARAGQPINTGVVAGDLRLLVNGGKYSKAEIDGAIKETASVLREGGINQAEIQTVVADMNSVAGHFSTFSATPVATASPATSK